MNGAQFIDSIEKVFGSYILPTQKAIALEWAGNRSSDILEAVYIYVLKTHSLQYKTCPFLAEFEKAQNEVLDEIVMSRANKQIQADFKRVQIEADEKIISEEYFREFSIAYKNGPLAMAELRQKYFGGV